MSSSIERRVEKIEQATGINEPCPVCVATLRLNKRAAELQRALNLPLPDASRMMRLRCFYCQREEVYPVGSFTPEEIAAFEADSIFYARGEMCRPEAKRAADMMLEAVERMTATYYGEHADKFQAILDDYMAEVFGDAFRFRAVSAYLCRVPGCGCDYPRTLAEWRKNVTENGYQIIG